MGFGDRLVRQILSEQRQELDKKRQVYRDELSRDLYDFGKPNPDRLKQIQSDLNLGDPAIEEITNSTLTKFEQRKQEYSFALSSQLYQMGIPNPDELKALQNKLNLSYS